MSSLCYTTKIFDEVGVKFERVMVPKVYYRLEGKDHGMPSKGSLAALFDIINKLAHGFFDTICNTWFGGSGWESNPPEIHSVPHNGFEDREAHRRLFAPPSHPTIGLEFPYFLWPKTYQVSLSFFCQ